MIKTLDCIVFFWLYLCKTWSVIWYEFCFHLHRVKINVTRKELLIFCGWIGFRNQQKKTEKKAVKVGDVFITFISVLETIPPTPHSLVFFAFLAVFAFQETFYDCSELKCFYEWRTGEKEEQETLWSGNVLLRILFHRKSFYLNNILFDIRQHQ